ncbi:hypothetical protein BH18ACI2_BH18ACI2_11910 [soil metagenome]
MKTRPMTMLCFALFCSLAIIAYAHAASGEDIEREAVKQAVLDYVEGVYEVNPTRIERSVHPDLVKRGFYVKRGESNYSPSPMTFAELVNLAKTYNKNGRVPKGAPKEVIVFDVLDQTASAKLVASWGVDYMHLAKYDGKWMIVNVLWQSPPQTRSP